MIFATFKNTYEVAPEKLKPTIHLFQPSKLTFVRIRTLNN